MLCRLSGFILFQSWFSYKLGVRYEAKEKGVGKYFSQSGVFCWWREVESCHFKDYEHAENVRSLIIESQRGKRHFRREFHFDPREVDEQKLQDILNTQIKQNVWSCRS